MFDFFNFPIWYYQFSGLWNFLALSLMGIFVYFRAPPSKAKNSLLLLKSFVVFWSINFYFWTAESAPENVHLWQCLLTAGGILAIPGTYYFILDFLEKEYSNKSKYLNYSAAIIILSINFFSTLYVSGYKPLGSIPYYPQAGIFFFLHLAYMVYNLTRAFLSLYHDFKSSDSKKKPEQIKWIFLGIFISWTSGALTYPGFLGLEVYPVLLPFTSLFTFCFGYAVIKHKLMDVEVVIRKALVFTLLFGFIFAALTVLTSAIPNLMMSVFSWSISSILINSISMIIITLLANPLKDTLVLWTDRYLFQKEVPYRQLMSKFSQEIYKIQSSEEMISIFSRELQEGLRLAQCYVYYKNKDNDWITKSQVDSHDKHLLVLKVFETEKRSMGLNLGGSIKRNHDHIKIMFEKQKIDLAVPILNHDELLGVVFLGARKSGKVFNEEEHDDLMPLVRLFSTFYSNSKLYNDLKLANRYVQESTLDGLTGLLIKKSFLEKVNLYNLRSKGQNCVHSLVMLDLDNFKLKNDTYGHLVGDDVLQNVASRIKQALRTSDLAGRFGGEEIVVFLPNTNLNESIMIADRIRNKLCETPIPTSKGDIVQTASFGVAQLKSTNQSLSQVLELADRSLYLAKKSGKNNVKSEDDLFKMGIKIAN
jgi:diguanylate cyclase (GGDEF)-like protein